jgi:hypothetical protein
MGPFCTFHQAHHEFLCNRLGCALFGFMYHMSAVPDKPGKILHYRCI